VQRVGIGKVAGLPELGDTKGPDAVTAYARPSPARTRTACGSSTTRASSPPRSSWGTTKTLVAYERYPDGPSAAFAPVFQEHGLIRLAIGLESREDLIAALDASLTTAYGPAR
jgi:hypothetical protein